MLTDECSCSSLGSCHHENGLNSVIFPHLSETRMVCSLNQDLARLWSEINDLRVCRCHNDKKVFFKFLPSLCSVLVPPSWAACRPVHPAPRGNTKLCFLLSAWLPLQRLPFPPNFKLSHEPLYIFLEITHTEKMLLLMSQISRKCAVIIREALSCLLSQPHLKCVTRTHLLFRNVPSHVPPNWCLSSGGISLLLYQMSLLYSTCKEFY